MAKLLYNNDFFGALAYLRDSIDKPDTLVRCLQVYIASVSSSPYPRIKSLRRADSHRGGCRPAEEPRQLDLQHHPQHPLPLRQRGHHRAERHREVDAAAAVLGAVLLPAAAAGGHDAPRVLDGGAVRAGQRRGHLQRGRDAHLPAGAAVLRRGGPRDAGGGAPPGRGGDADH